MRSYFAAAYDHIQEINRQTDKQSFHDWLACLLLVKGLPSKYNIWISQFMEKIENSTHYHDVLKFEELEAALTAEEARMKPDPYEEEANIIQAASYNRASTNQSTNPESNNASSTIITCKWCKKNHDSDKCWVKYPEKNPHRTRKKKSITEALESEPESS